MMKVVRLVLLVPVGALIAAVVQLGVPTAWWLNSERGIVLTIVTLLVLALVANLRRPFQLFEVAASIVMLWIGVNVGLTVMLFRVGPGTIFPIVLMAGAVISGIVITIGSLAGTLIANAEAFNAWTESKQ